MTSAEPFEAPVVESLSVRVVVDSVFDQFMPKATHPMVAIEHVGLDHAKGLVASSDSCYAEGTAISVRYRRLLESPLIDVNQAVEDRQSQQAASQRGQEPQGKRASSGK